MKNGWIRDRFDGTYGTAKFELVEMKKLDAEGALNQVVKGCDGVIHVASNVTFSPDPNFVVNEAIGFAIGALNSPTKEPSVKRWSTKLIAAAWAPPPYTADWMLAVDSASKAQAEQAMWKFMEDRKPQFAANSVLSEFICGLPVDLEKQGYGPSCGLLYALWNGDESFKVLLPQWIIDVKGTALLHVAALIAPDAKSECIYGFAYNKTWTDFIGRLRRMYADHKFPDPPENESVDIANVTGRPRAEDLLRWLGKDGFRLMEESLREVCDTMA